MVNIVENKKYVACQREEISEIFRGCYTDYEVPEALLRRLAKDLGFSYDLYISLSVISVEAGEKLLDSMTTQHGFDKLILLLNDETKEVVSYSLDNRFPLLNSDFMHRIKSLIDTDENVDIAETYYDKDDTVSSVLIYRSTPIDVIESYEDTEEHNNIDIGILLVNDESYGTYSKLVVTVLGVPVYLPSSYYNVTSSRYKRSTENSGDALDVMVLKILLDLRDNSLLHKIENVHYQFKSNKSIHISYEEYSNILRIMRKMPSVIEDNYVIDDILSINEEFEKVHADIEEQRSSYIWRCTAFISMTFNELLVLVSKTLNNLYAPAIEYTAIRELLGSYISTTRIANEIANH